MHEDTRKFRKAMGLAMDEIEATLAEREEDLEIEALEADIRLTFKGTSLQIGSRPRVEPGCPEPTRGAKSVVVGP